MPRRRSAAPRDAASAPRARTAGPAAHGAPDARMPTGGYRPADPGVPYRQNMPGYRPPSPYDVADLPGAPKVKSPVHPTVNAELRHSGRTQHLPHLRSRSPSPVRPTSVPSAQQQHAGWAPSQGPGALGMTYTKSAGHPPTMAQGHHRSSSRRRHRRSSRRRRHRHHHHHHDDDGHHHEGHRSSSRRAASPGGTGPLLSRLPLRIRTRGGAQAPIVRGSLRIEGVDFSKYEAQKGDTDVRRGLTSALRDDIIAEAGCGLLREDILLRLTPGPA
eukprot:gene22254-8088_t